MAEKITIWTLNRASNLLDTYQNEIKQIFQDAGYDADFGNRKQFMQDPGVWPANEPVINLMPGPEYFVPIAPKCIGELFAGSSQFPVLQKINDYYTKEAGQHEYQYFWDSDEHNYQMLTQKYIGYYSILKKTQPNFLIGYSQGGLVARYLYWLDRSVFQEPKPVVDGIITISSPNFGSPLANPANTGYIINGFLKIIGILLGISKTPGEFAGNTAPEISRDELVDILKELCSGLYKSQTLTASTEEIRTKSGELTHILEELYNWLGGLRNDPNNAFYDLNIFRLNNDYSIAASVFQSNPADTIRGIISTNNSLKELLTDVVWGEVIEILEKIIHRLSQKKKALAVKLSPQNVAAVSELKSLSTAKRQSKIEEIEKIINTEIMVEHKPAENPIIQQRIENYENGVPETGLAAYAHDFIIPSAYQLTVDKQTIPPGDNKPNDEANHISGSSDIYSAGRLNVECVKNFLKEMLVHNRL